MRNDILVVEISGKRPGDKSARPTEKFDIKYPHLIISNNSEGYVSEWDIVNVPDDYKDWYVANIKCSENAWYAPMNRSYAIKYAKEHGYKYLVQLDDNIDMLSIGYDKKKDEKLKCYRLYSRELVNDFIDTMATVLDHSRAAQVGLRLQGTQPDSHILSERYCYSFFMLNTEIAPDVFHGDFEDDIEYRLKQKQMGIGSLMIAPFAYSKTSQGNNKDLSGCRKEYARAGLLRGEHMRKLYGDIYSCGYSSKRVSTLGEAKEGVRYFKHKLKPFKVGIPIEMEPIKQKIFEVMNKHAKKHEDTATVKKKQHKGGKP